MCALSSNPDTTENLLDRRKKGASEDSGAFALDGGYAWVVLACAFWVEVIALGATYIGGVFVVEFREAFNLSPDQASWITSINSGVAFGCCKCFIFCSRLHARAISLAAFYTWHNLCLKFHGYIV